MSYDLFANGIGWGPSQQSYWDGQSIVSGAVTGAAPDDRQIQWSKLSLIFTRTTPTSIVDDVMVTSFAFTKPTLSFGCSILSGSDMAAVESGANTCWTAIKGLIPAHLTLSEYRWHHYDHSWTKPGPAVRVTSVASVATGASTNVAPDQVATSVTFKTSSRLHWGRCYLPQVTTAMYDATGRIAKGSCVDVIAAAVRAWFVTASGAGTPPIVSSSAKGAVLAISSIQMDNTPDVIRRRRAKHPEYRKVYTS